MIPRFDYLQEDMKIKMFSMPTRVSLSSSEILI